jgi:hypothetical protein
MFTSPLAENPDEIPGEEGNKPNSKNVGPTNSGLPKIFALPSGRERLSERL